MAGKYESLANRLEVASSWVSGERQLELLAIAAQLRGESEEDAAKTALETVTRNDAPTAKEQTDEANAESKDATQS